MDELKLRGSNPDSIQNDTKTDGHVTHTTLRTKSKTESIQTEIEPHTGNTISNFCGLLPCRNRRDRKSSSLNSMANGNGEKEAGSRPTQSVRTKSVKTSNMNSSHSNTKLSQKRIFVPLRRMMGSPHSSQSTPLRVDGVVDQVGVVKHEENPQAVHRMQHSVVFDEDGKYSTEATHTPLEKSDPSENTHRQEKLEECETCIDHVRSRLYWMDDKYIRTNSTNQIVPPMEGTDDAKGKETFYDTRLTEVEKLTNLLTASLSELKTEMESITYLSWLGLPVDDVLLRVPIPGRRAPTPNPQITSIRKSDNDVFSTIAEYKLLCSDSLSDEQLEELRSSKFSNWNWSDAHLIRFVRQMFFDLGFVEHFKLPLNRLDTWLCDVYRRYNRVPFHNYKHAFMVTQMAYTIIWAANLNTILEIEDQMALLVATICHDLDHPGFNNAYQTNAGTELAMRYNDQSPLENHHAAMAFEILTNPGANPFSDLPEKTFLSLRETIIRCILATDMSRHNEIVSQFKSLITNDLEAAWRLDPDTHRPMWAVNKAEKHIVLMIIVKSCDISNEARPVMVARPWINRLLAEFFHQSDYEKVSGLPVAPFMDREKVTKNASQCGFIRFVILPMFESLASLLPQLQSIIVQPALEQLEYYTERRLKDEAEECENDGEAPDETNHEDE